MNTERNWFEPGLPSQHISLLQQLVGREITAMIRFSSSPPEKLTRPGPELEGHEPLAPYELFSRMDGPLTMTFNSGMELAFGADEHCEIDMDLRRHPNGKRSDYVFEEDPEYFPLSAADPRFCRPEIHRMLGRRVLDVTLLRMDGARYERNRSFEAGLVFYVDQCPELVLAGNLASGLDNFVVTLRDGILPKYRNYLTEEPLLRSR